MALQPAKKGWVFPECLKERTRSSLSSAESAPGVGVDRLHGYAETNGGFGCNPGTEGDVQVPSQLINQDLTSLVEAAFTPFNALFHCWLHVHRAGKKPQNRDDARVVLSKWPFVSRANQIK